MKPDSQDNLYDISETEEPIDGATIYEIEDEDIPEQSEEPASRKMPSPLGILWKTMMTPVEGWKALKRAKFTTEQFAYRCFYPLCALAALSNVSRWFYEANTTPGEWMMDGAVTFMALFFGYFTVILLAPVLLPKASRGLVAKDFGRQFVMLALSTCALFYIAIAVVPMLDPVLVFLPLWTIYLIYKGARILRVPDEAKTPTVGLLTMLVIGAPLFWAWLLSEFFSSTGRWSML